MNEDYNLRLITQTTITMEELGELIQALGKYERNLLKDETLRKNTGEIYSMVIEEMADVEICLEKFKKLNKIEQYEIDSLKRYKEERLR